MTRRGAQKLQFADSYTSVIHAGIVAMETRVPTVTYGGSPLPKVLW